MKTLLTCLVLVAAATRGGPAQTDDWERQDRLYQERMKRHEARARPESDDPEARRREIVEAFLAEADALVRDKNYASREGRGVMVRTDDPRVDAGAAVSLLESFDAFFERFWDGRAPLRPDPGPGRVYLFYSFYKYNKLLTGDPRFGEFRPSGHYRPFLDVVVLHTDAVGAGDLPDVLVHEAAHRAIERRLFGNAAPRSPWLPEGLASYFGFTARGSDGTFQAGSIGGKHAVLVRGAERAQPTQAKAALRALREAMGGKTRFSLDAMLRIENPTSFYGEDAPLRYAAAWALVHFLFHGDGGAHAANFVRYLALEQEGRGGADALYETLAMSPDRLADVLSRHVRAMRAD